jgi:ribosomal 50S subunit-recycling heat shock protein
MRLDVYLNTVCILKSRTLAREACDRKKVRLNGVPAKGSHKVSPGDNIRLDLGKGALEIEILRIPPDHLSKKDAPGFYKILEDQR